MNLRMALGFSLCVASLMGCPTTEAGTDAGPRSDAPVVMTDTPSGTDAPIVADAPVIVADAPGADAPSTPDAPSMPDAPGPAVTWSAVHAALQANCTTCHSTGGSGGHNMAGPDEMASYTDSQRPSSHCTGVTKGACAAIRVRDGSMPLGRSLSASDRAALADLIDRWVAGGQLR